MVPPPTVALACDLAPFSRLPPTWNQPSRCPRAAAKGLGSRPSVTPAGRRPKAGEVARSVSQGRDAAATGGVLAGETGRDGWRGLRAQRLERMLGERRDQSAPSGAGRLKPPRTRPREARPTNYSAGADTFRAEARSNKNGHREVAGAATR